MKTNLINLFCTAALIVLVSASQSLFAQGYGESSIWGGATEVCLNTTDNYQTDFIPDSGYERYWSVTGGTINGSPYGSSVSVTWNTINGSGTLYVYSRQIGYATNYFEAQLNVTIISGNGGSVAAKSVCQGSNVTMTVTGNTGTIVRWEKADNAAGTNWSTYSVTSATSISVGPNHTNYDRYRAVSVNTCNVTYYSSAGQITAYYAPSLVQTSSAPLCPTGEQGTLAIEGGDPGASVTKWQYSVGGGAWTDYTTNQTCSYSVSTTTAFRAIISTSYCGTLQPQITIVANNHLTNGTITPYTQTVCSSLSNASPLQISGQTPSATVTWKYLHPVTSTWEYAGTGTTLWPFPSINADITQRTIQFKAEVSNYCGVVTTNLAAVTIDPPTVLGTISAPANQYCGASTVRFTLSGNVGGVQYWQYRTQVGGGSWSGWTQVNSTATFIDQSLAPTSTQTVTYEYQAYVKSGVCNAGFTASKSVTMKPVPTASATSNTICSGDVAGISAGSASITGTTYTWTSAVISGSVSGRSSSGNTAAITDALSVTNTQGVVRYTFTPSYNGCDGSTFYGDVTVKPRPTLSASIAPICSGQIANIAIQNPNNVPGTQFTWTVSAPNISGASGGSSADIAGNEISQALSQTTATDQTATYNITATVGSCSSTLSVVVTVKPVPTASSTSNTICSGDVAGISAGNASISGTTYTWTSAVISGTVSGRSASGSTASITDALSVTNAQGVVRYTFTPSYNGCNGSTFYGDVTVKPRPTLSASIAPICSGQIANIAIQNPNNVPGTQYTWTVSAPNITGASGGSSADITGNEISQTLSHSVTTDQTATYNITATAGSCSSTAPVVVTVKPLPVATAGNYYTFSGGQVSIPVSSNIGGTTFSWAANVSGVDAVQSGTGSPIVRTLTSANGGTATFVITPSINGCTGSNVNSMVTVYALPVITAPQNYVVRNVPVQMTTTASTYDSWNWKDSGGNTVSTASSYATATTDSYRVTVTKSGVSGTSAVYVVTDALPSQNLNYIVTNVPNIATTNANTIADLSKEDASQVVEYFDGLGRPIQTVSTQSSPTGKDIVQPVVYDAYGREALKFLPVTLADNGRYKANLVDEVTNTFTGGAANFYVNTPKVASDTKPYAQTVFENSPLNRVLKQGAPGENFQPLTDPTNFNDHAIKKKYEFNGANEVLLWKYDASTQLVSAKNTSGALVYFAPNQLMANKTYDEHNKVVIEYVDKAGRTLLKRVQAGASETPVDDTNYASTYYIYDDFGNLVTVIQPEGVRLLPTLYHNAPVSTQQILLNNLAFRYQYDARNRMIMKKVPGIDYVYMVYDSRDRLMMTQSGTQRAVKDWSFTKYDILNRPILTGIHNADSVLSQQKMQRRVDYYYANLGSNGGQMFETYVGNVNGSVHGYSNLSYPRLTSYPNFVDPFHYLTVTYYDNYNFKTIFPDRYSYLDYDLTALNYAQPNTANANVVGQVTGMKLKALDGSSIGGYTYLSTVNYYDDQYRVIQTVSDNYKGGIDRTTNVYDFTGKVLKNKTEHSESDVTWKDMVGVRQEGSKLIRTVAGSTWNDSGAASVEILPAGVDGWFEFVIGNNYGNRAIGFSSQNTDANNTSIDYSVYIGGNAFRAYEKNNVLVYSSSKYLSGDIVRLKRTGTTITLYKNDSLKCTFPTASTGVLMVDVAMANATDFLPWLRTSFTTRSHTIERRFEYDHAGRLLRTFHKIDGQPEILLSKNDYNELGQLIDKRLHSTQSTASDAKQSIDYRYNIRGWLTNINNATVSQDGATNDDINDLFGMNLSYDQLITGLITEGDKQFNGNISSMQWSINQSLGDLKSRGYKFVYDALNRLTAATHATKTTTWQESGAFHENNIAYDQNGNIQTLTRTDEMGLTMDQLNYNYIVGGVQGNRLAYVNDGANKTKGFKEPALNTAVGEYNYDLNGNMVWDYNSAGAEILKNFSFDTGSTDWAPGGETARFSFANGDVDVVLGSGSAATLTQSGIVAAGKPYILLIDIVKTSSTGDVSVTIGNATAVISATGTNTLTVFPISAGNVTVSVNGGFTGKITRVSLRGANVITYNYLNLPMTVSRVGDDQLNYIYDATGRKLTQELRTSTLALKKRSDYIGEYFYENDTLKFINHEEGRIVMTGATPEYQYHMKDHLGNVRLTFTTKDETESATATLETANLSNEQSKFLRMENARRVQSIIFDHTNGSATGTAQRLSGGANEKYGLARSLSVMPGDVINMEVYAKYVDAAASNTQALTDFISSIVNATAPAGVVVDGAGYGSSTSSFGFAGLLNQSPSGTAPKAYLNWIVFDRNYVMKDGGYIQISQAAKETGTDGPHERLAKDNLLIKEPGYVYIYYSNENDVPVEVFFDDFKVEQVKSPVVQMDDYYPFGLTFNSYQRENSTMQNYLYSGKERQDELEIGWLDYGARMYLPDIGRWSVVDPLSGSMEAISPYGFALNNPATLVDVLGLAPVYNWEKSRYEEDGKEVSWSEVQKSYSIGEESKDPANILLLADDFSKDSNKAMPMMLEAAMTNGNISVLRVKNAKDAASKLSEFMGNGKEIGNLIIGSHGSYNHASFSIGSSSFAVGSIKNDKNLGTIAGFVGQSSQIIIHACHAGNPDNGGTELLVELAVKMKTTVYGNQSWSVSNSNMFSGSFLGFMPLYQPFYQQSTQSPSDQCKSGSCSTYTEASRQRAFDSAGKWTKVTYSNGQTKVTTINNVSYTVSGGLSYSESN